MLLGSASLDLQQQAGESLAGRVAYLELTPILARELATHDAGVPDLWVRGGFPGSMLAHAQGTPVNKARLAASLEVSSPAIGRYVDLLTDLLLVRRLPP